MTRINKYLPSRPGEEGKVRPGVGIQDIATEPDVAWSDLELDRSQEDDRLIASVLAYLESESPPSLCLLTDDIPLARKAARFDLDVRPPRTFLTRLERASDKDKRISDLESQIRSHESRVPRLRFGFRETDELVLHVSRTRERVESNRLSDQDIANVIEQQRKAAQAELEVAESEVDSYRINEYHETVKHHLIEQRVVMERRRAKRHDHRMVFQFSLLNEGTAPARDVSLRLEFPLGAFAVSEDEEDNWYDGFQEIRLYPMPKPPWKRTAKESIMLAPLHPHAPSSRTYPQEYPQGDVSTGPHYFNERWKVLFLHPHLRPTRVWDSDSVVLYLPPSSSGGFAIDYEIEADGIAEPILGQLHVRFD